MLPTGQHTLITQPDNDGTFKNCILVKLTESCTQAIEDYLKIKDSTEKRPSIIFQKEKGEICFPIQSEKNKKFAIAISSVKESMKQDTSASVECIAYTESKFKKLGTIESKMTVQAIKDEVFQATMEKVNNVKEEEKNNSTRELKHSGAIVSRSSTNNNNQNNGISRAKQIAASIAANNNLKPRSLVNDRPLKERIIHLLALKPYMKPEIMLKLKKDNPSSSDQEIGQLDTIIQSVSILNHKNQYELTSEVMLNEVKEEWPFYNSSEKTLVKRNITNFKQKMNSQNTSHNSKLNTSLNSNKQFSSTSAFSSISYSNKANLEDQKKSSPLKSSMTDNLLNGKSTPNFNKHSNFQKIPLSPVSPEDLHYGYSVKNSKFEKTDSHFDVKRLKPNGYINVCQKEEMRDLPIYDFSKKYKTIQTKQQLKQYTLDFDQNHKEYSELYEFLAPTAKQFDNFQKELEEIIDQNSKEAVEKKDKILKVYFDKRNDQEYLKRRERYDYLDMKLNYIRDLIFQYKEKNEPQINLSPFSP